MTRVRIVLAPVVALVAGFATALVVNGTAAQARLDPPCPNTWCGPGMEECIETTNWKCFTDGSHCSEAWRCDMLPGS
jgi:hypothetical protein